MQVSASFSRIFGVLLLLSALGFTAWTTVQRAERVDHITATDAAAARLEARSSTGYVEQRRWLIVPEHHSPSYELIAQTQQMLASGESRVRHLDYENAPNGRPVYSASWYRWYLGGLAWLDQIASGRPIGASVEKAAIWAEPLLRLLLLLAGGALVARGFGFAAAVCFTVALAFVYPLGGAFLPALPDHRSLSRLCALGALLPLVLACRPATPKPVSNNARRTRRLFAVAGVAGGFGLWIDAPHHTWILVGTALGAVLAAILVERAQAQEPGEVESPLPWRTWAWAGALTSTLGYVAEYAPAHLEMRLEVNHPLYALSWLGLGELLRLLDTNRRRPGRLPRALVGALAVAATASLPIALAVARPQEWLSGDLLASRLVLLPEGAVAANVAVWLKRDGLTFAAAATFAPLFLLLPAVLVLRNPAASLWRRRAIALCLGCVAAALPLAMMQLTWWSTLDLLLIALLLALVAAPTAATERPSLRSGVLTTGLSTAIVVFGFTLLRPPSVSRSDFAFSPREVEALLERAAAHWISDRAGPEGAVVFLPPSRTVRWCYHGGPQLRGLGSSAWENREGLAATFRIAAAQTGEEAQALLFERGITHLILPSWDNDLQQFAQHALKDAHDAFIMAVHQWALPSWLRPVPYPLPVVAGFEDASIVVLNVTEETNRVPALARMVEYFLETNRPDLADAAGEALRQFPADANALVALAQLQKARDEAKAFDQSIESLVSGLEASFDRGMAWDRRVSLAIVLAQAGRDELAREQVQRCLERIDANRMLGLSTGALYRLQVLARAYDQPISDPALRARARQLLPEPLQQRFEP